MEKSTKKDEKSFFHNTTLCKTLIRSRKICHLESQGLCTSKGDSKNKSNIREVETPQTILYVWLLALLTYLPCD